MSGRPRQAVPDSGDSATDIARQRPAAVAALDRTAAEPLWSQILADLRRRLASGEFDRGFPPDSELVDDYSVSRHTVRDACRRLQDEGVLTRERGRGSFIAPIALEQLVGPLYSLFRTIEDQGYHQRSEVLLLDKRIEPEISTRLDLEPDAELVYLQRIRYADGEAFAVDEVWLPAGIGGALLDADFSHTALYDQLEQRLGIRPDSGNEHIHPALPTPAEATWLGIEANQPVFVVERRTDHHGAPLEWRRTVVRGDLFHFSTRWSPESAGVGFATSGRRQAEC
jgi:GntR family transcriptional regulator